MDTRPADIGHSVPRPGSIAYAIGSCNAPKLQCGQTSRTEKGALRWENATEACGGSIAGCAHPDALKNIPENGNDANRIARWFNDRHEDFISRTHTS